ncbi:MAG: Membrane protein insertase YidC [Candidatus Collierbacteria bacterium GW2011_GWB1_44_6]|uniref:Membrane protein insertase YidC n=2 Tax=Candidatus Collieribacteriota TaxID=1752725 RepID=A0A0G1JPH8_9BACT|nr:MAG: Membrane protein insertase YidC [Candidatus Collierbacteria bacterium GW2011_GWC2_43_12]KKT73270.1 MAG: Membrane protein insertase YidC [Candidatus Collierbacteria bacterium GW2011_GWB1_44_6]KKT83612.1 MAG: Membrane protein insertase YidC [Microgenomates group bacterium GW2011_GWC1_44_9]
MDFFTLYIYQPFFNILVGLYWFTGLILPAPDMGVAVILFAVAVRIILLPFDLIGEQSDEDKFQVSQKVKLIKKEFSSDPVRQKEEVRKIMRQSPRAIFSEVFTITIQVIIILILYRIFTTGLEGEDMHLLYDFMPSIRQPINLVFMGLYDLSHTNSTLNLIQSLMISVSEIIHLYFSPIKPTRKDFISLVLILPVVSFLVFMFLPAGKKVFIITSIAFSIVVRIIKQILYLTYSLRQLPAQPQEANPQPKP